MEKDLQFYLDNPDQLPDDPALLAELAEKMSAPVVADTPKEPEEDVKKEAPAPSGEETKKAEVKETEGEPTGIATRDGKGTIPYDVLKSEREKRQAAETTVAELSSKLEEIQAQLAKGTAKGEAKAEELGTEALATMTPEELDALRSDFPVFGNVIDKLMGTISTLSKEVSSLKQTEQTREADIRRSTAVTVQDHIDNEPVLVHLQTSDPKLFAKAVEIDNTLKGDIRFPTMADRFKKVAEIMESTFGPFEGVKAKAKAPETAKTVISKEKVEEFIDQKIGQNKAAPKSLSDIPAGDPPESSERDELENLSSAEISDRLMKMNPDQRTAFLNRIG